MYFTYNTVLKKITLLILVMANFGLFSMFAVQATENQFDGLLPLQTEEIKTALIKNSVTGTSPGSGFSFTVFYPKYGKLKGEAGLWGLYRDEGNWSVKDDIYCARWDQWLDNAERCYRVYIDGDAIFWVTLDGVLQSKDTLIHNSTD